MVVIHLCHRKTQRFPSDSIKNQCDPRGQYSSLPYLMTTKRHSRLTIVASLYRPVNLFTPAFPSPSCHLTSSNSSTINRRLGTKLSASLFKPGKNPQKFSSLIVKRNNSLSSKYHLKPQRHYCASKLRFKMTTTTPSIKSSNLLTR